MRKFIVAVVMTLALLSTFTIGASAHSVRVTSPNRPLSTSCSAKPYGSQTEPLFLDYYGYTSCTGRVYEIDGYVTVEQFIHSGGGGRWTNLSGTGHLVRCNNCSSLLNPSVYAYSAALTAGNEYRVNEIDGYYVYQNGSFQGTEATYGVFFT